MDQKEKAIFKEIERLYRLTAKLMLVCAARKNAGRCLRTSEIESRLTQIEKACEQMWESLAAQRTLHGK